MSNLTSTETLHRLQKQINPFILRRFKEDVQKSIPPKQETIIDIELTTLQKKYYRAIYEKNREFLKSPESNKANSVRLINIEIQLRKCCNHPFLIPSVEEQEVPVECTWEEYFNKCISASGKMVFLDKLLPKLKEEGHKVLIFSQMHGVLDILQDFLRFKNYHFERIDGNIVGPERQNAIDRFCHKNSDHFVFLLSTRAGGVGLNLAAADTAILFDSDWNPQLDLQAQARCHRIGQDRPVMVYRLVTKNTYESQMFQRASVKLGLDKAFAISVNEDSDGKIPEKDRQNLEEMLRYGAYRFLNENDDEAQKFCEKDIEELLKTNSHVLTHHTDPNSPHQNLIKMRFESDLADSSLDVTADNFWDKVLKSDQLMKTRKTLETEISALFSQLTKGEIPNFSSKSPDETFFREIEGVVKKFKGLKKPTEKCKNTLKKFLEYAESFKDIFSSKQYCVVKNWADEAYFGKKTAEKGKHSGIVKTSGNEEISKKGKNSLKNGKNSNNQPKNNLKQPRVVKICQKISKIDKKGKFSSQSDCFVCAGKRAKTKKTCEKSKNCTVRNCATRIHEICEEMLKKWFPKFYSKRKAFRCPLHFCSACYLSAKGARLVSCVGCLKSFHGECLPKGFWATGQKDDTKLEGFCAACDRKKKLNK